MLLFLSVPVTTLMWSALWRFYPWPPTTTTEVPAWFLPLARGIDWIQILTGIAGALALLALGRASRRVGDPRLLTRGLGIMILVQVPVIGLASSALSLATSSSLDAFEHYPPGQVVTFISYLLGAWQISSALRCLHATSRPMQDLAGERVTA